MNINNGSMMEVALRALEERGGAMSFTELWSIVKETLEITPEEEKDRIGYFYTDLSLSGDVVVSDNNTWDLSKRHVYKPNVDTNVIYDEIEQEKDSEDADEKKESEEYDAATEGTLSTERDDNPSEGEEDELFSE